MERTFEQTKAFAEYNLAEMERQLGRLLRTQNNYLRHGAISAATEMQTVIESKQQEIAGEQELFTMTFY